MMVSESLFITQPGISIAETQKSDLFLKHFKHIPTLLGNRPSKKIPSDLTPYKHMLPVTAIKPKEINEMLYLCNATFGTWSKIHSSKVYLL